MRIDILTLFPEMFAAVLGGSILKRAAQAGVVEYHLHQLRDYSRDPHRKVDDRPFGGGPGMVLMCQPLFDAVNAIEQQSSLAATRVMLCPQGRQFNQAMAAELAAKPRLLLMAGHYEGFDERLITLLDPLQVSIGDYVLSGGEIPAMAVTDAVVRLLPGALGHEHSAAGESFAADDGTIAGGLEYPQYTRPREFAGLAVPEILLSGDHAAIEKWRTAESRRKTAARRPDLLKPQA